MPIKNLTLGAILLVGTALAQNHYNTTHKVQKGDSLEKIAKATGTSKKALMAANHLSNDLIKTGQVLNIPSVHSAKPILASSGYAPYTLRSNDNDWKVANMFHMTPKAVRILNPQVNWKSAKAGTKIRIPNKNAYLFKLAALPVINSRYAKTYKADTIVRSAPGANAKRVAKVDANRHVKVLDRDQHWYKVKFEYGTVGWVRADLLRAEKMPAIYAAKAQAKRYTAPKATYRVAMHVVKPKATKVVRKTGRASRSGGGFLASIPNFKGDMLAYATTFKGTPYRYGSASRSGTDCSGFALQVLKHEGIKMPRTAAQQSRKGQSVSRGGLEKGDLVFFHTSRGSRISHVGIYIGDGKFIHASSGGGKVQVNSLSEKYYNKRFATARRVAKSKKVSGGNEKVAQAQVEDKKAMKEAEKSITTPVQDPEPKANN